MRKFLYILPVLVLLLSACSQKSRLDGKFTDANNGVKKVYLIKMENFDSPFQPTDSAEVKNGEFSFVLNDATEMMLGYIVYHKDGNNNNFGNMPFIYEKGNIKMTIDSASVSKVKGTSMNDKFQTFLDKLQTLASKMDGLNIKVNSVEEEKLREEMKVLQNEMNTLGYDFLKDNMKNKVGEVLLVSFINIFDNNQLQELLKLASPEYQKKVNSMLQPQPQQIGSSFAGLKFIDIKGTTPEGKTIAISDYAGKGKVVLVDFWASWCGPCIKEMPNVVAAYQKYKSKGFEIVGISLDDDKSKWTSAIKNLNMTWFHMSDLKGWESQLSAPYKVTSIPFTILIDKDGTIVAENLRGEELDHKLNELLN